MVDRLEKHDRNAQVIALGEYQKKSRDNGRTPVQWSAAENAGFTGPGVKAWMSVNTDYVQVNAEAAVKDPNSTYHYWATVLKLRKKYLDIFVYGNFTLLDKQSQEVFAYTRQYGDQKALVLCHWTGQTLEWDAASNGIRGVKDVLLNTYEGVEEASQRFSGDKWTLRPFEAVVLLV
jgi:glycosidase